MNAASFHPLLLRHGRISEVCSEAEMRWLRSGCQNFRRNSGRKANSGSVRSSALKSEGIDIYGRGINRYEAKKRIQEKEKEKRVWSGKSTLHIRSAKRAFSSIYSLEQFARTRFAVANGAKRKSKDPATRGIQCGKCVRAQAAARVYP